ncbi:MAG: hypothetical protein JXL67_13840 [Calditrichaeota bacterium]|nr:hypothetical protein [Calditrichota bacterium]
MKTIFILILSASGLLAGDPDRISQQKIILNPSLTKDRFHLSGFADFNSVPTSHISTANPAAISHYEKISAGLSFSYFSEIEFIESLSLKRKRPWLPASAGLVYPFRNIHFGAGYCQKYSEEFTSVLIPVTTPPDPGGSSGETVTLKSESVIHSPSLLVTYSILNVLSKGDKLSFGGQIYWDLWREEQLMDDRRIGKISDDGLTWKVAMLYKFAVPLLIGIHYEKGVDMEGYVEDNATILSDPSSSSQFEPMPLPILFRLPDKLSTGITVRSIDHLWISTNFSLMFWNDVYGSYDNELDFSLNLKYQLSEYFSASLGFFQNNNPREQYDYDFFYEGDTQFLNAGLRTSFKNFEVRIDLSDSHFLSSRRDETTLFSAAIDYQF